MAKDWVRLWVVSLVKRMHSKFLIFCHTVYTVQCSISTTYGMHMWTYGKDYELTASVSQVIRLTVPLNLLPYVYIHSIGIFLNSILHTKYYIPNKSAQTTEFIPAIKKGPHLLLLCIKFPSAHVSLSLFESVLPRHLSKAEKLLSFPLRSGPSSSPVLYVAVGSSPS